MLDRAQFVPTDAPKDVPYPIGYECTVPTEQMVELVKGLVGKADEVLEIGGGSGFLASRLAEKCKVTAVDVNARLLFLENHGVTCLVADGRTYDSGKAFDCIVVSFAARMVYPVWIRQLKENGKLIVPLRLGLACPICVFKKQNGRMNLEDVPAYARFTSELHDTNSTSPAPCAGK